MGSCQRFQPESVIAVVGRRVEGENVTVGMI